MTKNDMTSELFYILCVSFRGAYRPALRLLLLKIPSNLQSSTNLFFNCLLCPVMILSIHMLKRVGEGRYPCQTPTVVQNQSPMLHLKRTALVAILQPNITEHFTTKHYTW